MTGVVSSSSSGLGLGLASTVLLNNGLTMPRFGLGTWQSPPGEVRIAVKHALASGYVHIDCADNYFNHDEVGNGMRDSGVPREGVYLTSKIWNTFHHSYTSTRHAMDRICKQLGVEYVDQMLVHWPTPFVHTGDDDDHFPKDGSGNIRVCETIDLQATWAGMERCLLDDGLCRSIGVSNFDVDELECVLSACKVAPAVNQIECHPYFPNTELLEYCNSKGIHVTAYCPLGNVNPERLGTPLEDPVIVGLAEKLGKSPAQVIIRWHLQRGVTVIPKSVTPQRIEENAKVFDFELSEEAMVAITALGAKRKRNCNPAFKAGGANKWPADTTAF